MQCERLVVGRRRHRLLELQRRRHRRLLELQRRAGCWGRPGAWWIRGGRGSARRRRLVAAQSGTRMRRRREGEAAAARGCGRFGVPSERAVKMGSGRPGARGCCRSSKSEDLG
jgi:hypothetical protein